LLLERLKNETTRIAATKTLSRIGGAARSNKDLDLSPIMNGALGQLAQLLRQQSRGLKQTSLECLDTMVLCLGSDDDVDMDDGLFDSVLKDLGGIISDTDLHICDLSLSASNSILKARPSTGPLVKSHILPAALTLSKSPLLQNPALSSLLALLEELVTSKAVTFDSLCDLLVEQIIDTNGSKSSKQAISNLAEGIATITAVATLVKQKTFIKSTISAIKKSGDGNAQMTQLNLLVSGNFGRKVDLSSMALLTACSRFMIRRLIRRTKTSNMPRRLLWEGRLSGRSMRFCPESSRRWNKAVERSNTSSSLPYENSFIATAKWRAAIYRPAFL